VCPEGIAREWVVMICDAHLHYVPPKIGIYTSFYHGLWQDKERLFAFLQENQIARSLLAYPTTDAYKRLRSHGEVAQIYNQEMESLVKENSGIIACGILNSEDVNTLPAQINELADHGFRAVSLASSVNGEFIVNRMAAAFKALQKNDMAVFIHPQTENPAGFDRIKDALLMPVLEYSFDLSLCLGLLMVEGVLEEFNIKFIFSSLGGSAPFLKDRFDRVYSMLRGRGMVKDLGKLPSAILKRVYADTSGATLENIKMAVDLFGEDKILWGSDYPVSGDIKANLAMLDGLGARIKEKIVRENFLGVFPDRD